MNLLNFNIGDDFISLRFDNHRLDLHNDFHLVQMIRPTHSNRLSLIWQRSQGREQFSPIPEFKLQFEQISYFAEQVAEQTSQHEQILDFIGYLPQSMRDTFAGFVEAKNASADDDLILYFMNDFAIKINAETVELIIS